MGPLERYSDIVIAQANTASRTDCGLLLMTAYQAKGKEFDAVLIADATKRFRPDDEETRRLFYVAVTRASTSLDVITTDGGASPLWPPHRMIVASSSLSNAQPTRPGPAQAGDC